MGVVLLAVVMGVTCCSVGGGGGGVVTTSVVVCTTVEAVCLIPEPNNFPDCPLSGGAPRAVANGSAYSFATGLEGST